MMRSLAFLIVFLGGIVLGPLYIAYGQVDPCRALAAEKSRRASADAPLGGLLGGNSEMDFRRETATMSYAECMGGLVESWIARVTG